MFNFWETCIFFAEYQQSFIVALIIICNLFLMYIYMYIYITLRVVEKQNHN